MYLDEYDSDIAAATLANVPSTIQYQDEWEDSEWQSWFRGDDDNSNDGPPAFMSV